MDENKVRRHGRRSGVFFGVLLMIAGALFLAFNLGVFQGGYKQVIFSWPMLLVAIAIINYFSRHYFSGTIFLLLGVFFLIPRLAIADPSTFYWVEPDFTRTYWAVLLILGGLLMIFHIIFHPKRKNHYHCVNDNGEEYRSKRKAKGIGTSQSGFDRSSVFANVEEIILDPEFTGGEINAVFGGITLDLRKTTIPEGSTEIELNAVFGGITIYVPEDWYVELHLTSVFGGFEDKRLPNGNVDNSRKLIIYGSCVFAGGEVRN